MLELERVRVVFSVFHEFWNVISLVHLSLYLWLLNRNSHRTFECLNFLHSLYCPNVFQSTELTFTKFPKKTYLTGLYHTHTIFIFFLFNFREEMSPHFYSATIKKVFHFSIEFSLKMELHRHQQHQVSKVKYAFTRDEKLIWNFGFIVSWVHFIITFTKPISWRKMF